MVRRPSPSPSSAPPVSNPQPFQTTNTSFASALLASSLLEYGSAELTSGGQVAFVFDDPAGKGEALRRQYDAGLLPPTQPKSLFSARAYLLDEMAKVQAGGRRAR